MTIKEDTMTVDIPAAELPVGLSIPSEPRQPKPPKPVAAPVVPDPRDEEFRQAKDALQREQTERARIQQELDTERSKSKDSQTRSQQLEVENHKRTGQALYSHGQAVYSEHQQVINALGAVKMEMEGAKRELEISLNDDNLDPRDRARRIADAQERIASAAADHRALEQGKSQLETRLQEARSNMDAWQRRRPDPAPAEPDKREPQQTVQPQADPFETYVVQFPKSTQEWLRAHGDYVKDPKLNKLLQRAALDWDIEGKQLHTPEFTAFLDEKFFPKAKDAPVTTQEDDDEAQEVDVSDEPVAPVKPAAKSAPAAPVSRSTTPARASGKQSAKVTLTVSEQQHAIEMFGRGTKLNMTDEDAIKRYGRNKLHAEAEGKYQVR